MTIDCPEIYGGEIFNFLIPFFEQSNNLRCLRVGVGFGNANYVRFLSESLSRFNTLKEFRCEGRGGHLGDNEGEMLIRALAEHSGLTRIDLTGNDVGGRGVAALTALLNNPNSSLTKLALWDCSLDDEGATNLTSPLARNSALRKLNLGENKNIGITGWRAVFAQLRSPQSVLQDLCLRENSIDDGVANLLANALVNNPNLKVLNFSEITGITTEGWQTLFNALQNPSCMLQELRLHENRFGDEELTHLTNSLSSNCVLRHLDLHYIIAITASGWRTFSAALRCPNSALAKLDLRFNSMIDNNVLVSFANSLAHNNKLKELFLDYDEDDGVTITNWDALSNVLCNKSSINATFNSNHTLQRMFDPGFNPNNIYEDEEALRTLLQLNRENGPIKAARRKILKVHFSGDFNMQPFIDMDLRALPQAISWMAKDEHGSSLLYQFVRYTTYFVGIGGVTNSEGESNVGDGVTKSENEQVSKRQKM